MKRNFLHQITAASRTPDQGAKPPDPRSVSPLFATEFVEPPPPHARKKIPGYATVLCSSEQHSLVASSTLTHILQLTPAQ